MSNLRNSIKKSLNANEESTKKPITINLEESVIDDLRKIADQFNDLNKSKIFSRNYIIEAAVNSYVEEAKDILKSDYNIDIDKITSGRSTDQDFDTVIFPAQNDGFNEVFLNEDCWYSVRVSEEKIKKLKYIAIYRASPVSGITHYAEIDKFDQYQDTNKKIVYFKSKAVELPDKVELGQINANSMRSPRYTTLSKLLKVKELKDLF
ncbi:MAG: hypothetical protein RRZ84_07300 [Romboutsia sp.]